MILAADPFKEIQRVRGTDVEPHERGVDYVQLIWRTAALFCGDFTNAIATGEEGLLAEVVSVELMASQHAMTSSYRAVA